MISVYCRADFLSIGDTAFLSRMQNISRLMNEKPNKHLFINNLEY